MNDLFRTILNMSIAGGIVIAAILAARLFLRRAPRKWSYLIWIAAAFRLCCPVSIRSAISLFRVLPQPVSSGAAGAGETLGRLSYIPSAAAAPAPTPLPIPPLGANTGMPAAVTAAPAPVTSAPAAPGVTAAPVIAAASPAQIVMTVLSALWLAGMAALIIYAVIDYFRLRGKVMAATKLEGEKQVFLSENIRSPFILGFLRPRIYIPYGLTANELSCLLAHEKTHLRRKDHIVKAFAFAVLSLHWFNPLCWLAFLLMSRDMEMSCDEKVLAKGNTNKEYSTTLLSFAAGKRFPAPNPLAFGETAVKERIKNAMRYKKPKLIVSILALVLTAAIVAACVVNPSGEKPDPNSGSEQTETTPAPTEDPTESPTAAPTSRPVNGKGVSFTNSLDETVDKLFVCYSGRMFERMMYAETPDWHENALTAEGLAGGESVSGMEEANFLLKEDMRYDIGAFAGGRLYMLHDVPLSPASSVELASNGDAAEFAVTKSDGSETRYPAEVYEGDPFTVAARDENILRLDAAEYYCAVYADSSRAEGYRADWTEDHIQYDFSDRDMIAVVRFELLSLSAEDAARFPALASALETNNEALRAGVVERIGTADRSADGGYMQYNLASYVRRADTRVLSVLYQIWRGNEEFSHPEFADMSERRYESATFDTQTGMLLGPNDAADGIDGGEKYPPHENYAWTYDHDGVSFFDNSLDVPCCGEFVSLSDNPSLFNEKYLPVTENYIVTLSAVPGDALTVIHADGHDMALEFSVDRNGGYTDDSAAWSDIKYGIHAYVKGGEEIDYLGSANWENIHLDRILFVHANGRDYLYFLRDDAGPYSYVTIFGIHNGRIFQVSKCYLLVSLSAANTDPMDLRGFGIAMAIGSSYAVCRCAVNCCGVPMRAEWYSFYEEHTVLRELEVRIVGENGADTGETAVLEPGQEVIFFRTDGLTITDMLLPDGRIGRVETDGRGTMTIAGEDVSSFFDRIAFVD